MRIIPAYAGSTRTCPPAGRPGSDHPRIRGEHDDSDQYSIDGLGSSPHTRGALQLIDLGVVRAGIIPAYAGSTTVAECRPRTLSGSSPHTRGALTRATLYEVSIGIIPAYAGSTRLPSLRLW